MSEGEILDEAIYSVGDWVVVVKRSKFSENKEREIKQVCEVTEYKDVIWYRLSPGARWESEENIRLATEKEVLMDVLQ